MIITEVTQQVKAKTPVKKAKGIQKSHPYKGKLVGEADEPKADKSARAKLDHSLRAQGHKVEKDRKKEMKKGVVKHKGTPMGEASLVFHKEHELRGMLDTLLTSWKQQDHTADDYARLLKALGWTYKKSGNKIELVKAGPPPTNHGIMGIVDSVDEAKGDIRKGLGALAIAASLYGVGSLSPSAEDTPLGKELAAAAKAGDEVAAYHLDSLDLYVDENMQRTLVNLRIAYLEDSPRQDVKAYLSDPKRFPGVKSDNQSIAQQINWNK